MQGAVHPSQSSVPDVQMHVDGFGSKFVLPRFASSMQVKKKLLRRQVYSTKVYESDTGARLDQVKVTDA